MCVGQPIKLYAIGGGAVGLDIRDRILCRVGKRYIVGRAGHSAISVCGYTSVTAFLVLQQI